VPLAAATPAQTPTQTQTQTPELELGETKDEDEALEKLLAWLARKGDSPR
jgi:hypothetical protein